MVADAEVNALNLFSTRLVTFQFDGVKNLNDALCTLFEQQFAERFDMHPESMNLLMLAPTSPAITELREMFLRGLREWWEGIDATRPEEVDLVMFSNYAAKGEMTLPHNHNADLVGVYYARTTETSEPIVRQPSEDDDYFETGDGLLVLHDPRFNANMAAAGHRDYVRLAPRPGLMVIFPAYVWHSVTPHQGDVRRLSFSMNFTLRWSGKSNAVRQQIAW